MKILSTKLVPVKTGILNKLVLSNAERAQNPTGGNH